MYVRRGVLRDISILKIEAKTVNMYVRKGSPMHNYKIRKGGPRKKYVCKEEGCQKFSCHPPPLVLFFFWNSPYRRVRTLPGLPGGLMDAI